MQLLKLVMAAFLITASSIISVAYGGTISESSKTGINLVNGNYAPSHTKSKSKSKKAIVAPCSQTVTATAVGGYYCHGTYVQVAYSATATATADGCTFAHAFAANSAANQASAGLSGAMLASEATCTDSV